MMLQLLYILSTKDNPKYIITYLKMMGAKKNVVTYKVGVKLVMHNDRP